MVKEPDPRRRPGGITALSIFFGAGAAISLTSAVALVFPGSFLEPMWRLNPRARTAFAGLDPWAPVLLAVVCAACAAAALGLWRGRRWGHRLAIALIAINLAGDLVNVALGIEPRAIAGVPVAALILLYLGSARVRSFFRARCVAAARRSPPGRRGT
jgi:hypothetical protein